jgi:hypothetical protein
MPIFLPFNFSALGVCSRAARQACITSEVVTGRICDLPFGFNSDRRPMLQAETAPSGGGLPMLDSLDRQMLEYSALQPFPRLRQNLTFL